MEYLIWDNGLFELATNYVSECDSLSYVSSKMLFQKLQPQKYEFSFGNVTKTAAFGISMNNGYTQRQSNLPQQLIQLKVKKNVFLFYSVKACLLNEILFLRKFAFFFVFWG